MKIANNINNLRVSLIIITIIVYHKLHSNHPNSETK
jgi:hypothetical protein